MIYPWSGFYQPIDMNVRNDMKSGSTAPMKFQIGNGLGGYLSDLSIITSASFVKMDCAATAGSDPLEEYATGGTSLRYDPTAQQFIYNWQSPKNNAGKCWRVAIVLNDGTSHYANFYLK